MHPFRLATCLSFALVLFVAPATAQAQQAQEGEGFPRAPSLALSAAEGPTVGVWFPVGSRLQVGTEASLRWERRSIGNTESSDWRASVSLPVRIPLAGAQGAFVPYFVAAPGLNVVRGNGVTESTAFNGLAGFGLDWFPVPRVSVGGHVGASLSRTTIRRIGSDPFGNPANMGDRIDWTLSTRSSGIRVHLYFP